MTLAVKRFVPELPMARPVPCPADSWLWLVPWYRPCVSDVEHVDPRTGHYFDDTKRYVDAAANLDDAQRAQVFEGNARRVYPRLDRALAARGL